MKKIRFIITIVGVGAAAWACAGEPSGRSEAEKPREIHSMGEGAANPAAHPPPPGPQGLSRSPFVKPNLHLERKQPAVWSDFFRRPKDSSHAERRAGPLLVPHNVPPQWAVNRTRKAAPALGGLALGKPGNYTAALNGSTLRRRP